MTTFNTSIHGVDHESLSIVIQRYTHFVNVDFNGTSNDNSFRFTAFVRPTSDQTLDDIVSDLLAKFPGALFEDCRESEVAR